MAGFSVPLPYPSGVASRVAVFIDYQNVYKRARECFGYDRDHHIHGQVLPLRLGLVLRDMGIG